MVGSYVLCLRPRGLPDLRDRLGAPGVPGIRAVHAEACPGRSTGLWRFVACETRLGQRVVRGRSHGCIDWRRGGA